MIWIGGHIDTLKADDPRYAGFKLGSRGRVAQRPLTTDTVEKVGWLTGQHGCVVGL